MASIFPQAQQALGGLFNRVNQASSTPAFGLGMGLLSGNPQAGFQNAARASQMQQNKAAQERALKQRQAAAQQSAEQRAIENRRAEERLKLARERLNQPTAAFRSAMEATGGDESAARALLRQKVSGGGSSSLPSAIQEALFVSGGDPKKAAEFLRNRRMQQDQGISFTTPDGSTVTIGGDAPAPSVSGTGGAGTGNAQGAPSIQPDTQQEPFDFDVIEKATGPTDAALRILERTPVFGPLLGELGGEGQGTDQRRARLVMEDINNDVRRAFAINSSRISNFDLKLAEKLLPAASGVFTSEQGAVADMAQLKELIDQDITQNIAAIQTPFLRPQEQSEIQSLINSLSSASNKIGAVLDSRAIALEAKGRGQTNESESQTSDAGARPEGVAPEDWEFMTPEEKALFQ